MYNDNNENDSQYRYSGSDIPYNNTNNGSTSNNNTAFSSAPYEAKKHKKHKRGFAKKAALSNKKLQIVCPKRANDLVDEGKALHHCVGSYIDSVAEGKCLIVFVRRVEEPKKPYVTLEVRDGKIAQIHGDRNSEPTEEVQKFVELWSRKVLPMALQSA